jgi:hypothetical protein
MSIYRGAGGAGDAVADSASEALLVQQLAAEAQVDADAAAASASAAASSASGASSSASAASTSASNAATSATNASNSASSASTSATNAANSATAAQTAETNAETAETNAETAETNAASSASAASTSATTASTAATNASNSASAAATSATNASNSASAASTSASNASTSATAASGSASSASTSASNASTSATNASNSATSASTSASTATTQAGIATTKAGEAATSATNASNSASASATSATNAASAQSAAESARDATLAAYDSFDDRYLGSKSSAPTLDNDGNALAGGALYFDTVSQGMKVYTGSAWVDAYVPGSTYLAKASNLSDLTNTATARTNLGLAIGTNVQAYDADLATIAGLTPTNNYAIIGNGTSWTSSALPATGVTSVTGTSPVASSGGTTPAISLAANYGDTQNPYASKTANFVLASPNGSAGVPTFRAVVAADIPTLNQNTTGTASNVTGTVAIANGGTGQTTANASYNALSPMTTAGDITYEASGGIATRLPIGSAGQVLTVSSGLPAWAAAGGGGFPAGTLMLFQQTSAPTGWTKQTTHDNKALRVVSGTAGSGGSAAFTTAFGTPSVSGSVSATTLSESQMPSHTHGVTANFAYYGSSDIAWGQGYGAGSGTKTSNATGGGSSHTHSLSSATATINVQYVDLIIASKT